MTQIKDPYSAQDTLSFLNLWTWPFEASQNLGATLKKKKTEEKFWNNNKLPLLHQNKTKTIHL